MLISHVSLCPGIKENTSPQPACAAELWKSHVRSDAITFIKQTHVECHVMKGPWRNMIWAKERITGCLTAVAIRRGCMVLLFTLAIQVHGQLYSPQNVRIGLKTKNLPGETPLLLSVAAVELCVPYHNRGFLSATIETSGHSLCFQGTYSVERPPRIQSLSACMDIPAPLGFSVLICRMEMMMIIILLHWTVKSKWVYVREEKLPPRSALLELAAVGGMEEHSRYNTAQWELPLGALPGTECQRSTESPGLELTDCPVRLMLVIKQVPWPSLVRVCIGRSPPPPLTQ